jgi:CheY-like chemotaxis protein
MSDHDRRRDQQNGRLVCGFSQRKGGIANQRHWKRRTPTKHPEFTWYDFCDMRKIAVVDDNADNRLIIRTILEDQYDIVEYSSGIEAIEGFRKSKPDVVILDISLPEMDGTEILRRIRDDSGLHDLPVIALTAHAMVGDREKYLSAGFNDYVAKPILDMNVLFSTIKRWVS